MKTALVTGGTRGIGLSTAQKFIDQGWNVYITSRKEENLEAVLSENSQLKGFVARADDLAAATETCEKILDETGSLDVLINNAVQILPAVACLMLIYLQCRKHGM